LLQDAPATDASHGCSIPWTCTTTWVATRRTRWLAGGHQTSSCLNGPASPDTCTAGGTRGRRVSRLGRPRRRRTSRYQRSHAGPSGRIRSLGRLAGRRWPSPRAEAVVRPAWADDNARVTCQCRGPDPMNSWLGLPASGAPPAQPAPVHGRHRRTGSGMSRLSWPASAGHRRAASGPLPVGLTAVMLGAAPTMSRALSRPGGVDNYSAFRVSRRSFGPGPPAGDDESRLPPSRW